MLRVVTLVVFFHRWAAAVQFESNLLNFVFINNFALYLSVPGLAFVITSVEQGLVGSVSG